MKLREIKRKFVVYDNEGRVVVITRERKIALNIARKADERTHSR